MTDLPIGKYPNTFYRVSVKAVIRNEQGEVLVVKEHQDKWELPGGGLDHGESVHDCLKRELAEELNIVDDFTEAFWKTETQYMPSRPDKELDFWKMSMYFNVTLPSGFVWRSSDDLTDAKFMPDSVLGNCMAEIYFVRHGESQANASGVIAGSLDVLLTEKGIRQARDAGEMVVKNGMQIDTIISSPLSRAYETAKIIAETIHYPLDKIIVIDELREKRAGNFEGGTVGALYAATDEEMRQAGAESFADFAERVRRANAMVKMHAKGTTLIVGHAGIYRMAQTLYRNLPPADMKAMGKVANGKIVEYPL